MGLSVIVGVNYIINLLVNYSVVCSKVTANLIAPLSQLDINFMFCTTPLSGITVNPSSFIWPTN